ncbi:hypothetical protein A8U91_04714 [Halomonas elongata]|uniref:Uncharacterized protein n=1 Tax=Halomonas elongata TaxID=2746 RepID=A0A1B8P084_HALEL|nr:hypothetical protein [Halomonas elongata]OBX35640.1 hypothetical protein A8U91_04714 [Halomonas elongata]
MLLREYLKSLDENELEAYAQRAGTSAKYLRSHVMGATRGASIKFMRALASASDGQVSLIDVLVHYGVPRDELKEQAA